MTSAASIKSKSINLLAFHVQIWQVSPSTTVRVKIVKFFNREIFHGFFFTISGFTIFGQTNFFVRVQELNLHSCRNKLQNGPSTAGA
jgi:hypothetical protein